MYLYFVYYLRSDLTHRINKSQTDPYGHIGGSKRHLPRTFHQCPLKVPNKYLWPPQTIVANRRVQSWKIGNFSQAVDIFPGWLETKTRQIPVGKVQMNSQELNMWCIQACGQRYSCFCKSLILVKNCSKVEQNHFKANFKQLYLESI